nr:zinc finger, CCHC-type [Tanacetum cinerariifolium]
MHNYDAFLEPIPPAPVSAQAGQQVAPEALAACAAWVKGTKEIDGFMLMTMELDIKRNMKNFSACEMLQELKTLFAQQAGHELLQTVRDFHSYKQEEGQSERSRKNNKQKKLQLTARGQNQGKGKNKLVYVPKPKIPPPTKRENPAKDSDLALYDKESWNDPRNFAKPVKPTQVNKITTSCEICSGPHDTQYCMEDPEQAFVEYASSRTDEAGGLVSNFMASQDAILSKFEANFKQQQSEMTNKIDTVLKAITDQIAGALPSNTVKNSKLSASLLFSARSYPNTDPQCSNHVQGSINAITIHSEKQSDSYDEKAKENEEEEKNNLKISMPATLHCPIHLWHSSSKKSSNSIRSLNRSDWFLNHPTPRENSNRGVSNFTRRIKGMHVFIENFTYILDFMVVEDISLIIDPRLSQVVLEKPFMEMSNMTHDSPEGVGLRGSRKLKPRALSLYVGNVLVSRNNMVYFNDVLRDGIFEFDLSNSNTNDSYMYDGCEALVKRDTLTKPDKLEPRSIKCIFVGYPKKTMGYSFYYPLENKVLVVQNAEILENSLITQEEASRSLEDLEIIQKEDTHPSINTSSHHEDDDLEIDEPQSDIIPVHRSTKTQHAPDHMCLYVNAEEHKLGDLGEPAN